MAASTRQRDQAGECLDDAAACSMRRHLTDAAEWRRCAHALPTGVRMRPLTATLGRLFAGLLLAGSGHLAAAPANLQVRIDTGSLQGVQADGVIAFKGIPFAAPPVGDLRWRAPQPAHAWDGVRNATDYAPDCMQEPFPSDAAPLGTTPAEDCLYANVWRPAEADGPLPVLVWIYGGGFVNGGASPPTYAGDALARQGVLMVSFNYRVGRFGTFAHPQLTAADPDQGQLVNYGYMDQIAALEWVKRNVAAFGGDPARVTLIGESAGGMSVQALLTSPRARGLFQQAVIQSGGDIAPSGTPADAQRASLAFARGKGIADTAPDALARLRALPAEQVVDGLNLAALFTPSQGERTYSSPVADGTMAVDLKQAYAAGAVARVPVMVGATSDDIGGRDGFMVAGARHIADALTTLGNPVHYYRFGYVATSARTPETRGAGHASEIPFFFHTEAIKYGDATSPSDRRAGVLASGYLANFVKTGDPNGRGLPTWKPYRGSDRTMLEFDREGGAKGGPDPWVAP
jgi:para-nitrobenzyl esterase